MRGNQQCLCVQISRARAEAAARRIAHSSAAAAKPKSLREVEYTPSRTFDRVHGQRPAGSPNAYLSEYMGSFGSNPRYKPQWGSCGSLKVAGPYLERASPLYNAAARTTSGPGRWTADPVLLRSLRV